MATYTPSRASTVPSHPFTSTESPSHLHRSPKRARGTPSPEILQSSTSSSSSSSSSHRSRRPLPSRTFCDIKKVHSAEKRAPTASWQGVLGSQHMAEASSSHRRREMSVPLLSETLSTFSISHTSPLEPCSSSSARHTPVSVPFHIPSPSPHDRPHPSMTPRRVPMFPLHTPHHDPLPRDHSYPATAPLPQMSSFLGSPFSSRTARGTYAYNTFSPSRVAATENLRQGAFSPELDWMVQSEWMVEEELGSEGISFGSPSRAEFEPYTGFSPENEGSSGLVRDASGSTTSTGDWSGSATSSTSLRSLAKGSSEQNHQSTLVTIRGDFGQYEVDEYGAMETPSRQLFAPSDTAAEDALRMSGKVTGNGPDTSPLVGRSGASKSSKTAIEKDVSPLQAFLMARTPSDSSHPSITSPSPGYSPISYIPRLLSNTKSAFKREPSSPLCKSSSARTLSFASVKKVSLPQHVELTKSATKPSARRPHTLSPTVPFAPPSSRGRPPLFTHSPTSDTSEEISPSKPPPTTISTPSTLTASTDSQSPLGPARAAVIARRKTVIGNNGKKSAPTLTGSRKPIRPNMRRGVTEPNPHLLSPGYAGMMTPPTLFADIRPSPAAFASTGLVKKKSTIPGLEIPRFGESEPRKPKPVISPVKPVKSRLANMTMGTDVSSSTIGGTSAGTSDASVSVYVRNAQKTRGLRRKTSTMFASGSNGSIVDPKSPGASPLTPTKPNGLEVAPLGLGLTTPSPTTPTSFDYPFAPSSSMATIASSPLTRLDHPASDATEVSPSCEKVAKARPHLLRTKPIARASNPMLAASYRAQDPHSRPHLPAPGNRINSDFLILEILGQGEFSQVWKVKEKKTGGLFAVKAGRPYTGKKNRLRQLEEVAILHQLSVSPHPNIVSFIDSWEHNNRLYIRNALAPCGDLSTYLFSVAERGGMGEIRVWKTLCELSNGLAHIHKNNFIHLDLKPSNILITAQGSLQIADFGMSTILTLSGTIGAVSPALPDAVDGEFVWREGQDGSVPVPSPIIDREVEGDREYLSPEALQKETIGRPADVYSLGILLLEAALNVVLPPNGEGWVKLRQDDFSELAEHYVPRAPGQTEMTSGTEEVLPILSMDILMVIKSLMAADPGKRMTLDDVAELPPMKALREMRRSSEETGTFGPALVGEDVALLAMLLKQ